ncbi:hypothetical protein [Streptomyces albidoflavus]|uniref:hypothetical protein n=1 Tax=Streptomyces albidoflavus TaxID=1886 RepID=UPI0010217365|nr:hypothetical protein [Streptomyces albidoflavus]RZF02887.1 hypothetical protein C0R05_32260 [Streptomyces albidoflavus]
MTDPHAPIEPLDGHLFSAPPRRGPDDFVRIGIPRIAGYLRPADGVNAYNRRDPRVEVDPRSVLVAPALTTTIPTTTGSVRGLPLYAMATGSTPDPSLSAASAEKYYAALGQVIGYVSAGQNDLGLWVSGAVTAPSLTDSQRTALTESPVRADWRRVGPGHQLVALYVRLDAALLPDVMRRCALTKGELLRQLTIGPLADAPDDALMIVVKDAERNRCSPLSSITAARYAPLTTWSGDLVEDDEADETDMYAITLDPVN